MKLKGWTKLSIQILGLSASMIILSFLTEAQIWIEYFCYEGIAEGNCNGLHLGSHTDVGEHYHWNYRGWVYILTGLSFFGISVAKIFMSHEEDDFK